MRRFWTATLMLVCWAACAVNEGEVTPATEEVESEVTEIFRETWDGLYGGSVNGQNDWSGNCVVVDAPNKYLKCVGNRGASKYAGYRGAGSYTLLADVGPNSNVVNSTHGKLSLEGPQGRAFQIIVGCDNLRLAFQINGPTAHLLSFPCQSVSGPPAFRVVCNWSTGGTVLSCGASRLPADPTAFVDLVVPGPIRPWDTVMVSTQDLPGASLFDKIYIWQN